MLETLEASTARRNLIATFTRQRCGGRTRENKTANVATRSGATVAAPLQARTSTFRYRSEPRLKGRDYPVAPRRACNQQPSLGPLGPGASRSRDGDTPEFRRQRNR